MVFIKFGWINLFGAIVVVLMMVPNIVYAIRNKNEQNLCKNKVMNIIEQIGRYACIILMWLPLFVWEFGFKSVAEMLIYMIGNGVLLIAYIILFARYIKIKSPGVAFALAIIPACIFLLSGILLRHWLLAGFAVLFAIGHIYVTYINISKSVIYEEEKNADY